MKHSYVLKNALLSLKYLRFMFLFFYRWVLIYLILVYFIRICVSLFVLVQIIVSYGVFCYRFNNFSLTVLGLVHFKHLRGMLNKKIKEEEEKEKKNLEKIRSKKEKEIKNR